MKQKIDKSEQIQDLAVPDCLLPRLLWLFAVYEFPMTVVEGIERKINKYLWRVPPTFSSVSLYIQSGQLQLHRHQLWRSSRLRNAESN